MRRWMHANEYKPYHVFVRSTVKDSTVLGDPYLTIMTLNMKVLTAMFPRGDLLGKYESIYEQVKIKSVTFRLWFPRNQHSDQMGNATKWVGTTNPISGLPDYTIQPAYVNGFAQDPKCYIVYDHDARARNYADLDSFLTKPNLRVVQIRQNRNIQFKFYPKWETQIRDKGDKVVDVPTRNPWFDISDFKTADLIASNAFQVGFTGCQGWGFHWTAIVHLAFRRRCLDQNYGVETRQFLTGNADDCLTQSFEDALRMADNTQTWSEINSSM